MAVKGMHGKVALVTGASSGIRGETAKAFAACSCRVVMGERREKKLAELAVNTVELVHTGQIREADW